jgi:hypothetical protein
MKLIILSLCLFALFSCQTSIKPNVFEKALNESIELHEKVSVSTLLKSMQTEYILDSNKTYPFYKISCLINQQIDTNMLMLTNTLLTDSEVKKIYNEATSNSTNHFKNKVLFLKSVSPYLDKKANIDSIFIEHKGQVLRALCRYHLELFKIECLNQLVLSISSQCRWGISGLDTLICKQIDQSKFSIDLIQSKGYVTNFVSIDSVIKNRKKLPLMPTTQAMKYTTILNFDTLAPGNYTIKGTVNAVHRYKFWDDKLFTITIKK